MKNTILGLGIVALLITNPATSFAAENITPTVRTESEIRAQFIAIIAQLERVRDMLMASAVVATSDFEVSVDGQVVLSQSAVGMTETDAQAQCEAIAYNTANMWKLVTCEFAGDTIYKDVFIAG